MHLGSVLILAGGLTWIAGCKAEKSLPAIVDEKHNASVQVESPGKQAPNQDSRPLVVCFGDSLTAGFGVDPGASYPDYLQKDLDTAGYHYRVVNSGVSGNTTKDGLERLPGVLSSKPAIVVVEFGGNDGLRGLNVQTTRENLDTMVKLLKASGTKVMLAGITLPPDYGEDYIRNFTANYSSVAKQEGTPLLPFLLKDVYGREGMMQEDRTHATAMGNEVVARNVLKYLVPVLRK